jgi:hypothetical protein
MKNINKTIIIIITNIKTKNEIITILVMWKAMLCGNQS